LCLSGNDRRLQKLGITRRRIRRRKRRGREGGRERERGFISDPVGEVT